MQVSFAVPAPAMAMADTATVARQQADTRKTMYQIAFRECEAIVETVADECRLDAFTLSASPIINPMVPTQVTASATYLVVPKR